MNDKGPSTESQAQLSAEIEAAHRAYEDGLERGAPQELGPRKSVV